MSTGGTVIQVPVEDVKRLGRSTQGVIVMRPREGEQVSTLAPVVEQENRRGRSRETIGGGPQSRKHGRLRRRPKSRAEEEPADEFDLQSRAGQR